MWIERLDIQGFGALAGTLTFRPGMNLIVAPNETGKTTLAAALLSLVYGIRYRAGRQRRITEDGYRYDPHQLTDYGLSGAAVLSDETHVLIHRNFQKDTHQFLNADSGEAWRAEGKLSPADDPFGDGVFNLSREAFCKLAMIRQNDIASVEGLDEFSAALANMLGTEDGRGAAHGALDILDEARRQYDGATGVGRILVDNELRNLEKRIADLEREKASLESERASAETDYREQARAMQASHALEERREWLHYLRVTVDYAQQRTALQQAEGAHKALADVQKELTEMDALTDLDLSAPDAVSAHYARLLDLKKRIKHEQDALDGIRPRHVELGVRVRAYGALANVSGVARQQMDAAWQAWRLAAEQCDKMREKEEMLCTSLARSGVDASAIASLWDTLQNLTETARKTLLEEHLRRERAEAQRHLLDSGILAAREQISSIDQHRQMLRKSARPWGILAAVLGGLSLLAGVLLSPVWLGGLVPALLVGAYAGYLYQSAATHEVDARAAACSRVEQAERNRQEDEESDAHARVAFDEIAATSGRPAETLLQSARLFAAHEHDAREWCHARERLREAEAFLEEKGASLRAIMLESSLLQPADPLAHERLCHLFGEMREAETVVREASALEEEMRSLETKIKEMTEEASEEEKRLRDLLLRGGIEPDSLNDEAVGAYQDAARKKERCRWLRQERVPELQRQALPLDASRELAARVEALSASLQEVDAAHPEWAQQVQHTPREDVEKALSEVDAQLAQARADYVKAERALAVSLEHYRREAPRVDDTLAAAQSLVRKASRFSRASSVAVEILESLAAQTHRQWSPVLATQMQAVIDRYTSAWQISIGKDLQLMLQQKNGKPLAEAEVERHLSRGMLDQMYLALRLLLSRHMGASESLPLFLDDPFVHADDERFMEGMSYLLQEISPATQIFVFSCHQARHNALRERNPAWQECMVDMSPLCAER